MIFNRFYYCFTLLTTIFILSSCLNSNDGVAYQYSSDAQITSLSMSSNEDSLNVLPKVKFSINQVASVPIIFNKDSLPYLFDVSSVKMNINTNRANGIKLHLTNDSIYIWNMTDSVMIKKLKHIEVYAEDGITTKMYTFKLNTHQQDPDTIFWQNVTNNYIDNPIDQATVSNKNKFFTYYKVNSTIRLSVSNIPYDEGELLSWTDHLTGLPENIVLKSIQNEVVEEVEKWYALDADDKVYLSDNGIDWANQLIAYPVKSIFGIMPSLSDETEPKDSILTVVKDGDKYMFAKTIDFSDMHILNEIPLSLPVEDFAFTRINYSDNFSAKYLIVIGGKDVNNNKNDSVWLLQEDEGKISHTSKLLDFNVDGSSLFNYDDKIYLMTSEGNESVFYTSTNYGLFWEKAGKKQLLPSEFSLRKNQSINVDDKNNIWIFGGVTPNQVQIVDVWKGRINKLFVK